MDEDNNKETPEITESTTQEDLVNETDTEILIETENFETIADNKKPNNKKIIGILAGVFAGLIIILTVAFVMINQTAWAMERKVVKAFKNTFESDAYPSTDMLYSFLLDGTNSIDMTLSSDNLDITYKSSTDRTNNEYSAHVDVLYDSISLSLDSTVDDQEVKLQVPELTSKTFLYNYTTEKTGYINDILAELDAGITTDLIDEYMQTVTSGLTDDKVDAAADISEKFSDLVFEYDLYKADDKECTIDDEAHMCKGYTFFVSKEIVKEFSETFVNAYFDQLEQTMESYGMDNNIEEFIADDPMDIYAHVYLYKNNIARIILEDESASIDIELLGGALPYENFRISGEFESVEDTEENNIEDFTFEKTGSTTGTVSSSEYFSDGKRFMTTVYDTNDDSFSVDFISEEETMLTAEGSWVSEEDSFSLTLDRIDIPEADITASFSCKINSEASYEEIQNIDEIFDLGEADEAAWTDIYTEIIMALLPYLSY